MPLILGLGISIQQRRDSYERARREREEEEIQRKKQIQREKVSCSQCIYSGSLAPPHFREEHALMYFYT